MKNLSFYSRHCEDHVHEARLHDGFTDGDFNYYEWCDKWFAIDPETGLAVAYGDCGLDAVAKAHDPKVAEAMKRFTEKDIEQLKLQFQKLIAEKEKEMSA